MPAESEEPQEPVGPVEPLGRVCPLPKENPVVVDIEGDEVFMSAVFSDGRTWFWGYGYHPQPEKFPHSKDEICLRSLDMDGDHVGLSYERSVSLVRSFGFDFEDMPHTLDLPEQANPVVVEGDVDIFALDNEGYVWELRARDYENKIPSATEFQRMELSAAAADIVTDADFCARLVNGEVWCKSYSQAGSIRLGLGLSTEYGTLTRLPIEGAKDFSMNYFAACWLDQRGGLYCAGDDVPDFTVSGFDYPTFHRIPNVPPFKRVWMGMFNGCALAEDDWLWCWNTYQLTVESGREPIPVGYFRGVREVATHANTICVLREDHKVVCQGDAKAYSCSEPDEYGWWTIHFGTCDETGYCCKGESL